MAFDDWKNSGTGASGKPRPRRSLPNISADDRTFPAGASGAACQAARQLRERPPGHAQQAVRGHRLIGFRGHPGLEPNDGTRHRSFRAAQAADTGGIVGLLVKRRIRELSPDRRQTAGDKARSHHDGSHSGKRRVCRRVPLSLVALPIA